MKPLFKLVCTSVTSLVLLTGCKETTSQKSVSAPIAVQTIQVTEADHPLWISLLGQAEGSREVDIKAQVNGSLKHIRFKEGTAVKTGDILYEIDPAPFEAQLNLARANTQSARAELQNATKTFERSKQLIKTGAISQQTFDADKRALDVAKAKHLAAQASERDASIDLGWTKVRAPVDGRIEKSLVNPGTLISAQSTLLTQITQHDDVRVNFAPSSRALDGATITPENLVRILDEQGHLTPATLDYVAQSINPQTSTRTMRARLPQGSQILPGDFVRVQLMIGTRKNAVLVPQKAVRQLPDGTYSVFVFKDGKAVQQPIKVDRWTGPDWIATEGLKTGDRVITNQQLKLRNGLKVRLDKQAS